MSCSNCAVHAVVDGKSAVVELHINNLTSVDWSDKRNSMLYQCPMCKSYWEVGAYQPAVSELSAEEVAMYYPNAERSRNGI